MHRFAAPLLLGLMVVLCPYAACAECPQSCLCPVCHAVADSLNFQLIGRVSSHVDEGHAAHHVKHVLDTVCTVLKYDRLLETAPEPCAACEAADLAHMCLSGLHADRTKWQMLLNEHIDPSTCRDRRGGGRTGPLPDRALILPLTAPAQGMPDLSDRFPLWSCATGRVASRRATRRRRGRGRPRRGWRRPPSAGRGCKSCNGRASDTHTTSCSEPTAQEWRRWVVWGVGSRIFRLRPPLEPRALGCRGHRCEHGRHGGG